MQQIGLATDEIFALVDCNNFYVSCERVFDPKLAGKPVAVLSNNDGCLVSRSQEIKDLGIPMGSPGFKYEALIRSKGGTLLSSNYSLYGDMSQRVMDVLSQFSPEVEIYSIDEAFLGLKGFRQRDLQAYGTLIKETVQKWTGIPVSVGIANTKTLAKVANHFAKKVPAFQGCLWLDNPHRTEEALRRLPVGDIWGIGRQYGKFLVQNKICNALQLRGAEDKFVDRYLTSVGHKTVLELRGYSCLDLDEAPSTKKSIVCSRSFSKQVSDYQELEEAVSSYITRATEKLRQQGTVAGHLSVFLNTNRFKEGPQYNSSRGSSLMPPSAYTPELIKLGLQLLDEVFLPGFEYKKAGVMLADIIREEDVPLSFLEPNYLDDKRRDLMKAIDRINHKHGRDSLFFASSGVKQEWQMKRARLSPHYTTRWSDIPKVK